MLSIGSLFSGVGGLELGLEMAGLGPVLWQVEKDEFRREVLAEHWPSVRRYEDVSAVDGRALEPATLVCGGFPCRGTSSAGKRNGFAHPETGLWYEFARIVDEHRPRWVVVENVASGGSLWVDVVRRDLEQLGYASLPIPLSASHVGALHERARVFIVAHAVEPPERRPRAREGIDRAGRRDVDASGASASSDAHGLGHEAIRQPSSDAHGTGCGSGSGILAKEAGRPHAERGVASTTSDAHDGPQHAEPVHAEVASPPKTSDLDEIVRQAKRKLHEGKPNAEASASGARPSSDADGDALRNDEQRHAEGRQARGLPDGGYSLARFPSWAGGRFVEPSVVRVVHGVPDGLDPAELSPSKRRRVRRRDAKLKLGARRAALGDSVVPECGLIVGAVILALIDDPGLVLQHRLNW